MDIKRTVAKVLRAILQPPAITNSILAEHTKICSGTQVNDSWIDRYSYVGHECFLLNVRVGRFTSIADDCRIGGATHPMERVSMSPVFHAGKNVLKKNFSQFAPVVTPETRVGADVWIGAGSIVVSGVSIGTGAVVGAGSVVTKDIGPYEVWAGVPARKIRSRFDPDVMEGLLRSQWWDWEDERIARYAASFEDPAVFLEKLRQEEADR